MLNTARQITWARIPTTRNERGRPLRRPYSFAGIGVFVSTIVPQRAHTNTWTIACSSSMRADRDHAISSWHFSQIGVAVCSIDVLRKCTRRSPPGWEELCSITANSAIINSWSGGTILVIGLRRDTLFMPILWAVWRWLGPACCREVSTGVGGPFLNGNFDEAAPGRRLSPAPK